MANGAAWCSFQLERLWCTFRWYSTKPLESSFWGHSMASWTYHVLGSHPPPESLGCWAFNTRGVGMGRYLAHASRPLAFPHTRSCRRRSGSPAAIQKQGVGWKPNNRPLQLESSILVMLAPICPLRPPPLQTLAGAFSTPFRFCAAMLRRSPQGAESGASATGTLS